MSLPVFLVPSLAGVTAGSSVEVAGEEARHAVVVRRIRVGERVTLTDGAGGTAVCEVTATAKSTMGARVLSVHITAAERPRLVVVQAIPKGDRGELAVEMLTEVGVDEVVPWAASRCVAVWRGERAAKSLARWRSTAREAAKQARRSWFPTVAEPATTQDVAALLGRSALPVVLHEAATEPLAGVTVPDDGDVVVVVGPEGGLSDAEVETFAEAGARTVRLGSSVLRTSTAGVAAVSALLSRSPRWR